ncbi:hypothetical protein A3C09_02740 [Candidatus Uhrbacteria bacterium RIFCSPHIGHO2_02_FULL_47_44]|uniref:Uncharacterized protein n=1 Tax=Candidatus Uhrbacteria bacterium RIFCSPLOWO2_02_FULL_48_18 TaxID=1802408 RepID=A0A1F7V744_9BACT|nr:MAG: hypothetical protein A2839_01385 [Candidatus Uhrbacteria bacterium RIFCSPHIGHO2_01_FULL_47_10]OGL70214.1 MAG: hypothetical protein A3C09_02740 [Candidatus Uhrbacteria bacterium RIFCSPHIGHO2_02_FULL_47_44]OGL80463.1 MAG: hypothetical protein A3B20_03585 [Candidatus Uhrbacteria bacterium RIFCSPLOWO2_01_FULL_47_17]OGL86323.1 MAG: hypothetical protein A3I41_02065 [Candidatus Uhrbacteria bacterium RIFCSPLOWO2_02_FULL_48_18]OGL93041.1 MAG: hypothetical protein A3H12_01260 [Candidatus Uhrbacte
MSFSFPEISIPVFSFLGIFGLYMACYVLYSLFNIFHLVKYGIAGNGLFLIVFTFLGGTILLVAASIFLLLPYDWTYAIPLNQITDVFNENVAL